MNNISARMVAFVNWIGEARFIEEDTAALYEAFCRGWEAERRADVSRRFPGRSFRDLIEQDGAKGFKATIN
jgi:hypothetical protein